MEDYVNGILLICVLVIIIELLSSLFIISHKRYNSVHKYHAAYFYYNITAVMFQCSRVPVRKFIFGNGWGYYNIIAIACNDCGGKAADGANAPNYC